MYYLKDSISIDNESVSLEASWINSELESNDIKDIVKTNYEKISQIYKDVVTKITECLENGVSSCECIGSYHGDENIYASEGGLILSLSSLIDSEEGWIKLEYPSTLALEATCHDGFSFLLKDSNNQFFEVVCMLEENVPEYISNLVCDAVHGYEDLFISTYSKTKNLNIPFSTINVAYSGCVECDNDSTYTVEELMTSYGLSEEEAKEFVNQREHLISFKEVFI